MNGAYIEELAARMPLADGYGLELLKRREMVAPGVVKRVYEAVYTKVLVADAGLLRPLRQNLTPRTRAFFESLFPADRFDPASAIALQDAAAC
jgi:hypothetical protein